MSRANISKERLKLILRAEFGQNFTEETARAAGVKQARAKAWLAGRARAPKSLLIEIKNRDPQKALDRIERHYEASFARVENAKRVRIRVYNRARDVLEAAIADEEPPPYLAQSNRSK